MDDLRRDIELRAIIAKTERMMNGNKEPITNTAAMDPAEHLLGAMNDHGSAGDGYIERMEAAGQREFVKAAGTRLPAEGTVGPKFEHQELFDWSKWSIKIGDKVEGDDIWVHAELPPGWSVKSTDHAMWNRLVDDKGRERAGIFYKAASYDRSCHIRADCRYSAHTESAGDDQYSINGPQFCVIKDAGTEIHRIGPFESKPEPENKYSSERWRAYDLAQDAGEAYMKETYPDWRDPGAYWD